MSVAYVLDERFTGHRPPGAHPECPERAIAVAGALRDAGLANWGLPVPIRSAQLAELALVHTRDYLSELERTVPGASGWLDADTYYSADSWDAAVSAAAAGIDLVAGVLAGHYRRGLAVVRPPGHHARPDRAMGFCLLNNVAVAAATARSQGLRVAIFDWDAHHGNGTEEAFYDDDQVLYVSVHQHPFYPGTGSPARTGMGAGEGANINVGLPRGSGDPDLLWAFSQVVVPAVRWFGPDIILCSAGFDMHRADPLAGMSVTKGGFRYLAAEMTALADELCEGRLVAVLEGGYDLPALSQSLVQVAEALQGRPMDHDMPVVPASIAGQKAVAQTRTCHQTQAWTQDPG